MKATTIITPDDDRMDRSKVLRKNVADHQLPGALIYNMSAEKKKWRIEKNKIEKNRRTQSWSIGFA